MKNNIYDSKNGNETDSDKEGDAGKHGGRVKKKVEFVVVVSDRKIAEQ